MSQNYTPRRKRVDLSRFDTMQMHVRHPLILFFAPLQKNELLAE